MQLRGDGEYNALVSNRKLYFLGQGGTVRVTAETPAPSAYLDDHDILIWITHRGEVIDAADDLWYGPESVTFHTDRDEYYVIHVMDIGYLDGTYTCTVDVSNP